MSNARAILGAGLVTLSLWNTVSQAWGEYGNPIDADKFEIKPGFDEKTSTSRSHLDYGQARASVVLPKPTEITIDIAASSAEVMAMQFQGLISSFSQGAATVVDEVVIAKLGGLVALSKRNIAETGFVVTNSSATTTYVLGTDYTVNWARGELHALATGAIANLQSLKVDFTANAVDGSRILGGRNPQVRVRARFDGKNMVDGSGLEVDVHEAVLGASNGFDFLKSDFNSITLSGKVVTPAGKTEGYEVRI